MYRMGIGFLVGMVLLCLVVWECTFYKKPAKATYDFPSVMKENVRKEFLKRCLKGEVLYGMNCGKCHNVMVKRKIVIPDFTLEQLSSYDVRLGNKDHMTNLQSTQVTPEELGYIISFLSYKTKSGVPATGNNLPKE
jgi:hypothetical protein